MWYDQDEKSPSEIATLLHRDKSTLTRLLVKKEKKESRGRKIALSDKAVDDRRRCIVKAACIHAC